MDPNFQALAKHVMEAVTGGSNLGIKYKGLERLCTPHLLAETKDGRLVLQAFQFGGATSKGTITDPSQGGWRWLYLDEFEGLAMGPGPSHPLDLQKAEGSYAPPAFIVQILAMRNR